MHSKFLKFDFKNLLYFMVLLFICIFGSYACSVMKYKFKTVFAHCIFYSNVVESGVLVSTISVWCSHYIINW
jgi:hypothetical protein